MPAGAMDLPPDIVALRQVVYKLKNEVKHGEKGEQARRASPAVHPDDECCLPEAGPDDRRR